MTMEITLENGFMVTIPSHELIRPLTGLGREGDNDGKLITDPNYKQITIYRDSPLGDSVVLGRVFLSQVSALRPTPTLCLKEPTQLLTLSTLGRLVGRLGQSGVQTGQAKTTP
jgi:hypothetical protein